MSPTKIQLQRQMDWLRNQMALSRGLTAGVISPSYKVFHINLYIPVGL